MASFVVTGASRGIGLELSRQLLALPAAQVSRVFALSRGQPSAALNKLLESNTDRVFHVTASVDDASSVQKAVGEVKSHLGGQGLDVLVNNAGATAFNPNGLTSLTPEQLADTFDINVIGVQRTTAAFLPLLEAGKQKKVINMSSTMGAISWAPKFKLAPNPAYKVSKAALNMLNAQWALSYADAGFTFLLISPGWLRTDLGGDAADLPVEVGVGEVIRIILETDKSQNGKFINIHVPGQEEAWGRYDGKEIEW